MFVVDTNVLLYAADRDSPDQEKRRAQLEAWGRQSSPWQGDPWVNIQNDKGYAKAYQVRQVLKAIDKLEAEHGSSG